MLKDRILATLRFFDLQDMPLTLLELHWYLIADKDTLMHALNTEWEVVQPVHEPERVSLDQVQKCVESDCRVLVEVDRGYYHLAGKKDIVDRRLANYLYGIRREKRIRKFGLGLRHIPFVRGAALGGSQAFGQQKDTSDIDLFLVTDPTFMWIARTFVTAYFQLLGVRRHGKYITNRFCLNHYTSGPKPLEDFKNLYTGMEYGRHRPLAYPQVIAEFHRQNSDWMRTLFPNFDFTAYPVEPQSRLQRFLERVFTNSFGRSIERWLKAMQMPRIRKDEFIIVENDELSFHPHSKQAQLLKDFFGTTIHV